jgi:hypothetical protein
MHIFLYILYFGRLEVQYNLDNLIPNALTLGERRLLRACN